MIKEVSIVRAIVQRVKSASVSADGVICGQIDTGFLIYLGVTHSDTTENVDLLVKKISKLRIFEDENGKTNLSLYDVSGSVLVVSQFTLYADTSRGNRPDFISAAKPEHAKQLYEYFVKKVSECEIPTQTGIFAASMSVKSENDGPFTIFFEC
jgi:D-tyrosyl-tRNA(Tyr) deacylase